MLITAGERKAIALLCMALHDLGVEAESFTGSQAGFITDTKHTERQDPRGAGRPHPRRRSTPGGSRSSPAPRACRRTNDVTFLGRGGSDTTAVALAQALDADACELYTDVSGVFTADPRVVAEARKMHHISFDELLEMTATGCPKPAMRSVEFARRHGVQLHVRSAFTWEPGTWVTEEDPTMEQADRLRRHARPVRGEDHRRGRARPPGVAARLFRRAGRRSVNVDMIVQNVVRRRAITDISFTVPHAELDAALGVADELARRDRRRRTCRATPTSPR